jgi:hypothetical protein
MLCKNNIKLIIYFRLGCEFPEMSRWQKAIPGSLY